MSNKLSAQLIKAEMLGDKEKVESLKRQLQDLHKATTSTDAIKCYKPTCDKQPSQPANYRAKPDNTSTKRFYSNKASQFLKSTGSLAQMFEQEKKLSSSDEVKMYMKTSAKFARDDMETKHFAEEIDDSQAILNKSKRFKPESHKPRNDESQPVGSCERCPKSLKHLLVDQLEHVSLALVKTKPFLSSASNVIISNSLHSTSSFVSAPYDHYLEVNRIVEILKRMWDAKGYRCLVMETYIRDRRTYKKDGLSGGNHYQIHCLPIKEKHFERSRMIFRQAMLDCEQEWSMNKKLIVFDGRRLQRCIPNGLSYFWVCFDSLSNGFGHVIENENNFSAHFGVEVLSGLLDKEFNPMRLNQYEGFDDQFARCRDFKLDYFRFKQQHENT